MIMEEDEEDIDDNDDENDNDNVSSNDENEKEVENMNKAFIGEDDNKPDESLKTMDKSDGTEVPSDQEISKELSNR